MVTNEPGDFNPPQFPPNIPARFAASLDTERSRVFSADPGHTWLIKLFPRLKAHWQIKTIAIPVFVTAFFVAYFQLLRNPVFPVIIMPVTMVDHLIGFHPAAILPYLSLWLYVFFAPALLVGVRELVVFSCEALALTVVGLGTFFLWPTAIPTFDLDAANHPLFALLKRVDAAGNACPSLHVAFAVFTMVWLARFFRKVTTPIWMHVLNVGFCAAIVYSTLATKQHVAVDALAGFALGATAAFYNGAKLRKQDAMPTPAVLPTLPEQILSSDVTKTDRRYDNLGRDAQYSQNG